MIFGALNIQTGFKMEDFLPEENITPEMIVEAAKKKLGSAGKERVLARMQTHYHTIQFSKLSEGQKKELLEWINGFSEVDK